MTGDPAGDDRATEDVPSPEDVARAVVVLR